MVDLTLKYVFVQALFDTRDKSLPVPALEERAEVEELEEEKTGNAVSRLTITPAYTEDRQYYVCQAVLAGETVEECNTPENRNCDEEFTLLRVKDPLAALYPFVGIVAEVKMTYLTTRRSIFGSVCPMK